MTIAPHPQCHSDSGRDHQRLRATLCFYPNGLFQVDEFVISSLNCLIFCESFSRNHCVDTVSIHSSTLMLDQGIFVLILGYRLYTLLGWILVFSIMPVYLVYCLLTKKQLTGLWQRFGFFLPPLTWNHPKRLWFHAASVGEVQAARAIISALRGLDTRADFIITTVTQQGHRAATMQLAHGVTCLYAPIDLPFVVKQFIAKLSPDVYICLETELWPNTLRLMQKNGTRTLLLNGRLSESSFKRYKKIAQFMKQVVRCFDSASVIQEIDRERYVSLGLEHNKIQINGNAKYDQPIESCVPLNDRHCPGGGNTLRQTIPRHYQDLLGLKQDQNVLIAGSTHSGEESMILDVFSTLTATIPDLVLIIAPRHLERLDQIMGEWREQNISFKKLSQARQHHQEDAKIILVDQMGELACLYSIGTYVFCGGSLVDRGGHNVMEPAIWAKPPFFGPYMNDFNDARLLLEKESAGFLVNNTEELISKILYFHLHQDRYQEAAQRAQNVAVAQQGAATRQAIIIRQALKD